MSSTHCCTGLQCRYIERTTAGRHVFAVYFDDDAEDDVDAQDRGTTEPAQSDSDNDDADEEPAEQQDDNDSRKRKCDDEGESEKEQETGGDEWTPAMQKQMDDLLQRPLPSDTAFVYKKVRIVTLMKDPNNAALLIIVCSCGYPGRIGCCCRHIWCMLFTMLKCQPKLIDGVHSVTTVCGCNSTPRTCAACEMLPTHEKFQWDLRMDFLQLVNLDIGSKIKYHAMLRTEFNATSCFPPKHTMSFHPRIPASIFAPFAKNNDPVKPSMIPRSGLPQRPQQGQELESSSTGGGAAAGGSRRTSNRQEVPTLAKLIAEIESIWTRTERLKDSKDHELRSNARALMLATIRSLGEQVSMLHTELAPKREQRYYTARDKYMGIAKEK